MRDDIVLMSVEELQHAFDADAGDSEIRKAAELFLNAMNDWPNTFTSTSNFVAALKKEIGHPLTLTRINEYQKKLSLGGDAWKIEGLSSLLGMFAYDRTKLLEDIVFNINQYYRHHKS